MCFSAFPAVFIKQHKNNMESMKNTTEEVVCFPYLAFFGWVCVSADDICRSSGLVLLRLPVRRFIAFVGRFLCFILFCYRIASYASITSLNFVFAQERPLRVETTLSQIYTFIFNFPSLLEADMHIGVRSSQLREKT